MEELAREKERDCEDRDSDIMTEEAIDIDQVLRRLDEGKTVTVESFAPERTFELGRRLGERCRPGQIYTLTGDLGVGKTVFTQGFAAGLGVTEPVCSPTFTILQVYEEGRMPFYHFDVYRIADVEEMEEIGYEDCFYGRGVCLIEWANLIGEILPDDLIGITIEKEPERGFDFRRIRLKKQFDIF